MGLLDWLERRDVPSETNFSNPASWLTEMLGGGPTAAGVSVNAKTALNIAAVYCAVRVHTDTLGATPVLTYRRLQRGRERATEHPVYRVLHQRANPEMTPFTFKETLQGHIVTRGNGYAEIEWGADGQVRALWPLLPDRTKPFRHDGERYYRTEVPTRGGAWTPVVLPAYRVLHIPGFGFDGNVGYDPITLARESLAFTKATEEFGSRFFGNGTRLSGILSTDSTLSPAAVKTIRESWELAQQGLSNAHRTAILDNGLKWTQLGVNPENAQFLESRQFQLDEVARWFKVPPHKLYNLLRSTNNNIEHQSLEFVQDTAQPWFVRWEEALSWSLFTDEERSTYYAEFLMDSLLRGDSAGRAALYKEMFAVGAASPNSILERENMNPVEGGDRRFVPLNMVPLDRVDDALDRGADGPRPQQRASVERVLRGQHPVFLAIATSVVRAEINAVQREAKRGAGTAQFRAWAVEFAATRPDAWTRALQPAFLATASIAGAAHPDQIAGTVAREIGELRSSAILSEVALAVRDTATADEEIADLMHAWTIVAPLHVAAICSARVGAAINAQQ